MTGNEPTYNLAAIRKLLLATFTVEDLWCFCEERPLFQPILNDFSPNHSLNEMVHRVIVYCERRVLLDQLLTEVRAYNPDPS